MAITVNTLKLKYNKIMSTITFTADLVIYHKENIYSYTYSTLTKYTGIPLSFTFTKSIHC